MLKISTRKAELLYKMNGEYPFSYRNPRGDKLTIYGIIRAKANSVEEHIFKVCEAEEYFRKIDGRSATLASRNLLDSMYRMLSRADYLTVQNVLAELTETHDRIVKIISGNTIEPRRSAGA